MYSCLQNCCCGLSDAHTPLPPHHHRPAPPPPALTGMVKHGLSPAAAAARFYILDHKGLITERVGGCWSMGNRC